MPLPIPEEAPEKVGFVLNPAFFIVAITSRLENSENWGGPRFNCTKAQCMKRKIYFEMSVICYLTSDLTARSCITIFGTVFQKITGTSLKR